MENYLAFNQLCIYVKVRKNPNFLLKDITTAKNCVIIPRCIPTYSFVNVEQPSQRNRLLTSVSSQLNPWVIHSQVFMKCVIYAVYNNIYKCLYSSDDVCTINKVRGTILFILYIILFNIHTLQHTHIYIYI